MPFANHLTKGSSPLPRLGRLQRWIPGLVLGSGLLFTAGFAFYSAQSIQAASAERFSLRAKELHSALQARLYGFAQSLRDVQAYVGQTDKVTPVSWRRLHQTLRESDLYPGSSGLIFVRVTPAAGLPAVLAEEHRNGEPTLTVKPPGQRDYYAVLTAIEPHIAYNLPALGYDAWAEPKRRETMERARDSGNPQITSRTQLHIDRDHPTPAFLIYQPVYRGGALPTTTEERRQLLIGFAGTGIRYRDLMQNVLPPALKDVAVDLYDAADDNAEHLVFSSKPGFRPNADAHQQRYGIEIGGRAWTLVYHATEAFTPSVETNYPRHLLLAGIIVSLLAGALSRSLVNRRLKAEELATQMTASLRHRETQLGALVAQAPLGIWIIDKDGTVRDCNAKLASFTHSHPERIIGFNLLTGARDPVLRAPLRRALAGESVSLETEYTSTVSGLRGRYHFHFQPVYVEGALDHVLGFVEDIHVRKEAEDRLAYLAHHDTLTGLANRSLLKIELEAAIAAAERNGRQAAVLFLDLDHFNTINDSLGHSVGDQLLVRLAERLTAAVGGKQLVSRIGGDEFVVLLKSIAGPADCVPVAEQLLALVHEPVVVDDYTLHTSASIGIACWPSGGADVEALSRSADMAMYHAKHRGRNNFQFFTDEMSNKAQAVLHLESELHEALARDEFQLYFQAQVDATDNRLIGAEALIRWVRRTGEIMAPGRFISFAEERGLIVAIGEWVIRSACRQIRAWIDAGYAPIPVAVNISAKQFHHSDLVGTVRDALKEFNVDADLLALEITESTVMEDPQETVVLISQLQALGIRTEIDDFGTGYSSLSALKRFPFHRLKIDKSFIDAIPGEEDDEAIVAAILNLASSLELDVIAEGVETPAQRDYLLALGCPAMQGYLFCRPEPPDDFTRRLAPDAVERLRA